MKPVLMILLLIVLLSFFESCYYDKQDLLYPDGKTPCDTSVVAKFSSDVLSVMNASCNTSGCHNTTSAAGGVILDTYNGVKTQGINGRLMGSMNQTGGYSAMPRGAAKLNSCTLIKIQQWINSGTPNN
jgi:hypothetical protein